MMLQQPNGSDSAKDPCCGCFLLSLRVVFNESSDARSHGTHISWLTRSPMLSNTRAFHVQLHTLPVCMPFNQMESTEWKAQRGIRLLGNIAPNEHTIVARRRPAFGVYVRPGSALAVDSRMTAFGRQVVRRKKTQSANTTQTSQTTMSWHVSRP
ncbi:hypothetical protein EV126DRAFT_10979 [Verticillium dahliae]|nr:hypothetical protein EV126DRAFT_10979 [Verticillium dahliae]